MKNRKVWKMLQLLSEREILIFSHWMAGELHDKQHYLERLCTTLLEALPNPPTATAVWKKLYPQRPYDDARLRKLNRDLTRYIEQFLAMQALGEDSALCNNLLLSELSKRGASKLFDKLSTKIDQTEKSQNINQSNLYLRRYQHQEEKLKHFAKYAHRGKKFEKQLVDIIHTLKENIDNWWMETRISLAMGYKRFDKMNLTDIERKWISLQLQSKSQDHDLSEKMRIVIYYQAYLLTNGEEKDPDSLINKIRENQHLFAQSEVQNFITSLINYFLPKIDKEKEQSPEKYIFQLFEWAIEDKLIFIDNHLPAVAYKNLIVICIRVGDFERAWTYLNRFEQYLVPEQREETYRYNLGYYYYACKDYKKVIETFVDKAFSNILSEIDARVYILRAHYELGTEDPDWLIRQIGNLIRFVRNNKELPSQYRGPYLTRLRLFRRLVKAHTNEELMRLSLAAKTTRDSVQTQWLQDKIRAKLQH